MEAFTWMLLLFLQTPLAIYIAHAAKSHYMKVFTQDTYRQSYLPNTFSEETYTNWTERDVPNPPYLVNETSISEEHAKTMKLLHSDIKGSKAQLIAKIRCPFGWHSIGPFCTTLSIVPAYTQCPLDAERFAIGPGNPVMPSSTMVGMCQTVHTSGVQLECPDGFNLKKIPRSSDKDKGSIKNEAIEFRCVSEEVIAKISMLSEETNGCPLGYSFSEGGCLGLKEVRPEPACPKDYTLGSFVADPYAFYGQQRLGCEATVFIKGKLWCPHGYHITGEPYPEVPFGGVLLNADAYQYKQSKVVDTLLTSGFVNKAKLDFIDELTCFQVLVVLASSCDERRCHTSELKQLRKRLIDWAYLIRLDPDFVLYSGIPSGADFQFTSSAIRQNWL